MTKLEQVARVIWYIVADATVPSPEPFIVIKVDTSVKRGSGVEGTVVSLHCIREEAESIAARLNGELSQ